MEFLEKNGNRIDFEFFVKIESKSNREEKPESSHHSMHHIGFTSKLSTWAELHILLQY